MSKCATCGESISENFVFCSHCGAKVVTNRLTLSSLGKNLFTKLTNLDFVFLRTSKGLLVKPQSITLAYIGGMRKLINSPIQYAIVAISLYGLFQIIFADFIDLVSQQNFMSSFKEGWNSRPVTPDATNDDDAMNLIINWLQSKNQIVIFLMIPCVAMFSYLFFKKVKEYNLAEHFVISTYAISFTIVLNVLMGILFAPLGTENAAQFYIESFYIFNVIAILWIYKKSLNASIFKTLLILFLAFFVTSIVILIAAIPIAFLLN